MGEADHRIETKEVERHPLLCMGCSDPIIVGEKVTIVTLVGIDLNFHPDCLDQITETLNKFMAMRHEIMEKEGKELLN
jgi:hypothetical protein